MRATAKTKTVTRMHNGEKMQFALMADNYGPFRKHVSYPMVEEGYDWVRLRLRGKTYYVGKWLIHDDPMSIILRQEQERERDEEDQEEEDWNVDLFSYN